MTRPTTGGSGAGAPQGAPAAPKKKKAPMPKASNGPNSIWARILQAADIKPTPGAETALALWSQSEGGLTEYVKPGDAASGNIWNPFNIIATYGQDAVSTTGGSQGDIVYFANEAAGIKASGIWLKQEAYLHGVYEALKGGNLDEIYKNLNLVRTTLGGKKVSPQYPDVLQKFISSGGHQDDPSGIYTTSLTAGQLEAETKNPLSKGQQEVQAAQSAPNPSQAGVPPAGGWDWSAIPGGENGAYGKLARQAFAQYDSGQGDAANKVEDLINQDFPQYSFLMKIPEFRTLIVFGALGKLSPDRVMGMIEHTSWWENTDPAMRYAQALRGSDIGAWREAVMSGQSLVAEKAEQLGISLTGKQIAALGLQVATQMAGQNGTVTDNTYNSDQITRLVVGQYNAQKQGLTGGGDVSTLVDDFQHLAGQYMYNLQPKEMYSWLQRSMMKDMGAENFTTGATSDFENFLKTQAQTQYPFMKEQIAEGVTPAQFLQPYSNAAATVLQQSPNAVQSEFLPGGKFAFALSQKNPQTHAIEPMSLADFTDTLKSNAKFGYQYTDAAQNNAWTEGAQLLRAFGAISGSVA